MGTRSAAAVLCRLCLASVAFAGAACSSNTRPESVATVPPPSAVDGTFVPDALTTMVQRAVDANRRLAEAAGEIADVLESCPGDLTAGVAAWRTARLAWDAAGVYLWGPAEDSNFVASIDFWPADAAAVEAAGAGSDPMTQLEYDSLGAASRGLPALEVLLFGDQPPSVRGCSYGRLAAKSVATAATGVATDFEREQAELTDGDPALIDALSIMADAVYRVCDVQLGMPSGDTVAGGPPDPSLVRQGPGLMAVEDVRAVMNEVGSAFAVAVQPIIAARYDGAGNPIEDLLRQFDAAFDAVGDDLAEAITERPDAVAAATNACRGVRRAFSTNVSGLLGVTLILPIGDGD